MSDNHQSDAEDAKWREHNLSQLEHFRSLDLRTKLGAVEGMADVVRRFRKMRSEGGFRGAPSNTDESARATDWSS